MKQRLQISVLFIAGLMLPAYAHADLIVGVPEAPNSIGFADGGVSDCVGGAGSGTIAGFTVSSNDGACFPYSGGESFVENGSWLGLPMLLDTTSISTLTINLGGSYSQVWGFMNYALFCDDSFDTPCTYSGNDPTVTALDKNMNVLESYDIRDVLNGSSSRDINFLAGDTVGISRSSSDIAFLQIGGDYIAMADISLSGGVPEPSTMSYAVIGAIAIGAFLLRKSIR